MIFYENTHGAIMEMDFHGNSRAGTLVGVGAKTN